MFNTFPNEIIYKILEYSSFNKNLYITSKRIKGLYDKLLTYHIENIEKNIATFNDHNIALLDKILRDPRIRNNIHELIDFCKNKTKQEIYIRVFNSVGLHNIFLLRMSLGFV